MQLWKTYAALMKKLGYTPVDRYPIVARWRSDIDFVHAAINNYQPHVVSGEVKSPADLVVQDQPCLRFNDIDNVGITGRHLVCHLHLYQFTVQPASKYDQEKYLRDIITWLTDGVKIPLNELKFHEDAWGGGGNLGVSMEYFSRGLELGNQVYITYEVLPNGKIKELKNKVLDMGAGHERLPWVTQGNLNCYETSFPTVCKKLYKITGLSSDYPAYKKFAPHAGVLNMDELKESVDKTWKKVTKKAGITLTDVEKMIKPLAALYSIADHARALLFALADGAIPSNVGGGYNLRFIYRRAYDFIQKYNWKIDIPEVCKWHAEELKPQYPELIKAITEVQEILRAEEKKYLKTKEKSKLFIFRLKTEKKKLSEDKLIGIYDSFGITPEILKEHKVIASIPSDFYSKVAARHAQKEQEAATVKETKYNLESVPETKKLFYDKPLTFKAKVLKTFGNKVVLDKTAFYPTSGGQLHDLGTLNNCKVVDVIKQDNHIIHILDGKLKAKTVTGKIDAARRKLLCQHHTATHIIAGSARSVLGAHVWQAGSKVTPDYARLDITHYANLTSDQTEKIEKVANQTIKKAIKVDKKVLLKHKAEALYGFRLYQGGAIPGSELRIGKIKNFDVEACAGVHTDNTREVERIKIVSTKRIQDGVVRLEYRAGTQAKEVEFEDLKLITNVLTSLRVSTDQIKSLASELVHDLNPTARVLRTSPQHLLKTVARFIENLEDWGFELDKYLKELNDLLARSKDLPVAMNNLFKVWRTQRKIAKKNKKN